MAGKFLDKDGLIYYDRKLRKVINPAKFITLSLGTPERSEERGFYLRPLYIQLNNFTEEDIGSKICLYRMCPRSGTNFNKKWVHPKTDPRVQPYGLAVLGYAAIANMHYVIDNHVYTYPGVPYFMENGGVVPVEWNITLEHIQQGYIKVDISRDFVALISNPARVFIANSSQWDFAGRAVVIGAPNGEELKFKYCQVIADKPVLMSVNTLRFGIKSDILSTVVDLDNGRVFAAYARLRII